MLLLSVLISLFVELNSSLDKLTQRKASKHQELHNMEIMEAKSIMMYIMRRKALNLVEIAKHLNLKNHATVSIKCSQFSGWLEVRKELAIIYKMVQERYQFYLDTLPTESESEIDILIKAQQEHHELMMYRLNKIKQNG